MSDTLERKPATLSRCSPMAHEWWPDDEDQHAKCPKFLGRFYCRCACHQPTVKKRRVVRRKPR